MRRIVVVQTAFLGDVVLTTPLLAELRRAHPEARISVVATPVGAEALEGQPFLDDVERFDKRGRGRGPLAMVALAGRLQGADAAVAAQRSARTGLLVRLSGAPHRIGFRGAPGAFAYTEAVPWRAEGHAVSRYLDLARPLGGSPEGADPRPRLEVLAGAGERIAERLRECGVPEGARLLAVAPGSVWGTKRWLPSGFAAVLRGSAERGLAAVLVGSGEERPLCREIAEAAGVGAAVLAGRMTIPDLAAVLGASEALVSNDSGSGHVASAVGTPVVTVFGPTVPAFGYAPFGDGNRVVERPGLPCRPCDRHGPDRCPLGHFRCMREIGAEEVLSALDEALEARAASGGQGTTGRDGLPAR